MTTATGHDVPVADAPRVACCSGARLLGIALDACSLGRTIWDTPAATPAVRPSRAPETRPVHGAPFRFRAVPAKFTPLNAAYRWENRIRWRHAYVRCATDPHAAQSNAPVLCCGASGCWPKFSVWMGMALAVVTNPVPGRGPKPAECVLPALELTQAACVSAAQHRERCDVSAACVVAGPGNTRLDRGSAWDIVLWLRSLDRNEARERSNGLLISGLVQNSTGGARFLRRSLPDGLGCHAPWSVSVCGHSGTKQIRICVAAFIIVHGGRGEQLNCQSLWILLCSISSHFWNKSISLRLDPCICDGSRSFCLVPGAMLAQYQAMICRNDMR